MRARYRTVRHTLQAALRWGLCGFVAGVTLAIAASGSLSERLAETPPVHPRPTPPTP